MATRRALGARVYGAMGIARDDQAGRAAAVLRYFEFFGAPLVGIVCMHRELCAADAVSVGMFLQTLVLALTARGLGTCVAVSVATIHRSSAWSGVLRRSVAGSGRPVAGRQRPLAGQWPADSGHGDGLPSPRG